MNIRICKHLTILNTFNTSPMLLVFLILIFFSFFIYLPGIKGQEPPAPSVKQGEIDRGSMSICVKSPMDPDETGIRNLDDVSMKQLEYLMKIPGYINAIPRADFSKPSALELKGKIASQLRKAAEIEPDPCHKLYLNALADGIPLDRFYTILPEWNTLKQNKVEIVFLPVPASDTTNTRKYDTYIYVNDEAETQKYEEYTRDFEQIQGNLPYKVKSEVSFTNRSPSIKIAHLVYSPNSNAASLVYPGPEMISLYNYPIRTYKIVIFKNRTDAYVDSVLKLIGNRIIGDAAAIPTSADVDSESYLSNLVMHRISHHFGQVFRIMPKKNKPAADERDDTDDTIVAKGAPEEKEIKLFSDIVKDNFPLIEDIKTDVVSVYNVSYLKKEGLILPDDEIVMYNTYVASLLDRLRRDPDNPSGKSALIQFNYLLKEGAVVFNITTKKLSVQAAAFVDAMKEFAKATLEQSQFFYGILRENYKAGPELEAYMDCLKDIPTKMSFQLATTGK